MYNNSNSNSNSNSTSNSNSNSNSNSTSNSNSNSTPPPHVHLQRTASATSDAKPHLPRGECRYIMPPNAGGIRERCPCASFDVNELVPGSQCQCGHQAWHHVQQPAADFVPVEDHMLLVDRCKKLEKTCRGLVDELRKEREAREKLNADMNTMIRGAYGNMAFLKYYVDEKMDSARITFEDKIEGALDRAADALNEVNKLSTRVVDLDEACIRLEERIDDRRLMSRSATPSLQTAGTPTIPQRPLPSLAQRLPMATLPVRSRSKEKPGEADGWNCKIIVLPKKTQRRAFAAGSKAYKRCESRGLHQDIVLEDKGSACFVNKVEAHFSSIFKNRPWMPLQYLNSADMSLGQLHIEHRNPASWNYALLESLCLASDRKQGDIVYVALMHEELGWPDIESLPPVWSADNECWEHDSELDGNAMDAGMDFKMELDSSRVRSTDTDSMYEYSPPPYTSRIQTQIEQRLHGASALGALADLALAREQRPAHRTPSRSERSMVSVSAYSLLSRDRAPSLSDRSTLSGRSIDGVIYEDGDEYFHRTKRHRHLPPSRGAMSVSPASPPASTTGSQKVYYSGRAKRKVTLTKQKEPLNWGVSDVKFSNPMRGLLHRRRGDEDELRSDAASS